MGIENLDIKNYKEIVDNATQLVTGKPTKSRQVQKARIKAILNGGADGIAFIMQPVSNSEGSSGGGLGYMGISPSIGVEFDTWDNPEYGDPTSSDHAAIVTNGDGNTHLETVTLSNIEDGQYHDFIFNWVASTKTMTV